MVNGYINGCMKVSRSPLNVLRATRVRCRISTNLMLNGLHVAFDNKGHLGRLYLDPSGGIGW